MRRTGRDELARQMSAWFDRTGAEERGPAAEVVLLGLVAAPIQLCTVLVLGVAFLRRLQGRRAGRFRWLLVGVVAVQVMLQLTRWAVLRRLYRAVADAEGQPASNVRR